MAVTSVCQGYDLRPMKLTVIQGTPAPDTPVERVRKRLRAHKPPEMLQCLRCAGREVIETRTGMVIKNGRPQGGVRVFLCATCHRNGERVVIA